MPAGLSIAAVNAPALCVASGPSELIERFSEELAAKEIDFTPIHIDVAAHSSLLDSILEEFRAFCRTIDFKPPQKPVASNLTGRWLSAAEATDPEYWVQHLRGTVRFEAGLRTALDDGPAITVELGPGQSLTSYARRQDPRPVAAISVLRHANDTIDELAHAQSVEAGCSRSRHRGDSVVWLLPRLADGRPVQDVEHGGIVEQVPVLVAGLAIQPGN